MSRQPCASISASISRASAPQPISKVPPGAGRAVSPRFGAAIMAISVVSPPGQGCAAGDFRPSVCDGAVPGSSLLAPVSEPLAAEQVNEVPGDARAELAGAGDAAAKGEGQLAEGDRPVGRGEEVEQQLEAAARQAAEQR